MKAISVPILFSLCLLPACGCGRKTGDPPGLAGERLLAAAQQGDLARVDALLTAAAKVDARDACLWTPLMQAASYGHIRTAERLLRAGAATELTDKGSYTALMLAASNNHAELVALLLDFGGNPNHRENTNGWSALIWAAKRGHLASVRVLLDAGANPMTMDFRDRTALDWARLNNFSRVAELLGGTPPPNNLDTGQSASVANGV